MMSSRMIISYLVVLYFVLVSLSSVESSDDSIDQCKRNIPDSLAGLLTKKFPEFRLPKMTDHVQEDITYSKEHGGDGCLSVAIGDFDGDGKEDVAALLTDIKESRAILVAALWRKKGWKIFKLSSFVAKIRQCYVEKIDAGVYNRFRGLHSPITDPDEREHLETKNASILAGMIETTGMVYVYSQGKWLYVWISD